MEAAEITDAIARCAAALGRAPSRREFVTATGISEHQVLHRFANWGEAVRAAGLEPHSSNAPVSPDELLEDWGALVRRHAAIPTRRLYEQQGRYSGKSFEKHLGAWVTLPQRFREFATNRPEWRDVLDLMPDMPPATSAPDPIAVATSSFVAARHPRRGDRPVYGNPLDFRGLRHEPVNEDGVVFLFGMVARELGYMVEAVQAGFPDCEAKRQVAPNKWQRVRIEFEYESRNFRDHGHNPDGCDLVICWAHNWPDMPAHLEVLELKSVIQSLAHHDD